MDPPVRPNESDCCNSGCNPCIFDAYEDQLRKFNNKLKDEKIEENSENVMRTTAYKTFVLISSKKHTKNTHFFVFRYVNDQDNVKESNIHLKFEPGQHFILRSQDESGSFTRAYTPIPHDNSEKLCFTILVRLYQFGRMSKYLSSLKPGHEASWRGPYGNYPKIYSYTNILFIAQGTGIAPIYSVITDILNDENCDSFIHLFFCCKNNHDIMLRDKLYQFREYWNFRYDVFLSDSNNIKRKYDEVIHERKLEKMDIDNYLQNKNKRRIQIVICGSIEFNSCFEEYALACGIGNENIHIFS